jgi:glycosyltransferase involved in cell wall biosynthesis
MNTFTPPIDTLTEADPAGALSRPTPAITRTRAPADVEIVIPVFNEQQILDASVRSLHEYLTANFSFSFQITIADNASTDRTLEVARALARHFAQVEVLHLEHKGRGRALRAAWSHSDAEVLAYMDVDLSTELSALGELLVPLLEGRGDLAIGSRLTPGAQVTRGLKREVISRAYNLLLRVALRAGFSDAQCGFKAGRRVVVQTLLNDVQDDAWFFDTELLYLAQRSKLSIHEVPVRWIEDRDSRVQILSTAREDLRGVMRLRAAAREQAVHRRRHLPHSASWLDEPEGRMPADRSAARGKPQHSLSVNGRSRAGPSSRGSRVRCRPPIAPRTPMIR